MAQVTPSDGRSKRNAREVQECLTHPPHLPTTQLPRLLALHCPHPHTLPYPPLTPPAQPATPPATPPSTPPPNPHRLTPPPSPHRLTPTA